MAKAANPDRRRERAQQAFHRKMQREQRSAREQLELLIRRGHGHCREAERLRKEIESEQAEGGVSKEGTPGRRD